MAPKKPNYTERVQVYLHPKSEQDRIVFDVWKAFGMEGRGAEAMRAIVRAGVKAMYESGDLPQSVVDRCRLDERLAPRRLGIAPQGMYAPQAMPAAPIIPYDNQPPRQEIYVPPGPAPRPNFIEQPPEEPPVLTQDRPQPPRPQPAKPVTPPPPQGENIPKGNLLKLMM